MGTAHQAYNPRLQHRPRRCPEFRGRFDPLQFDGLRSWQLSQMAIWPQGLRNDLEKKSPDNPLPQVVWNGEACLDPQDDEAFDLRGGQDFYSYSELEGALRLYQQVGANRVETRSQELSSYCRKLLEKSVYFGDIFSFAGSYQTLAADSESLKQHPGIIAIDFERTDPYPLYQNLNERGIHLKCIKGCYGNHPLARLRIGIPYYENSQRLEQFVSIFNSTIKEHL